MRQSRTLGSVGAGLGNDPAYPAVPPRMAGSPVRRRCCPASGAVVQIADQLRPLAQREGDRLAERRAGQHRVALVLQSAVERVEHRLHLCAPRGHEPLGVLIAVLRQFRLGAVQLGDEPQRLQRRAGSIPCPARRRP